MANDGLAAGGGLLAGLMTGMIGGALKQHVMQKQQNDQLVIQAGMSNPALFGDEGFKRLFDKASGNKDLSNAFYGSYRNFQSAMSNLNSGGGSAPSAGPANQPMTTTDIPGGTKPANAPMGQPRPAGPNPMMNAADDPTALGQQLQGLQAKRNQLANMMMTNPMYAGQIKPMMDSLDRQISSVQSLYQGTLSRQHSDAIHADTEQQTNARFDDEQRMHAQEIAATNGLRDAQFAMAKSQARFNDYMKMTADGEKRTQAIQGRYNVLNTAKERLRDFYTQSQQGGKVINPKQMQASVDGYNKQVDQLQSMAKRYGISLDELGIDPDDMKIHVDKGSDSHSYAFGLPIPLTGSVTAPSIAEGNAVPAGNKAPTNPAPTGANLPPPPSGVTFK